MKGRLVVNRLFLYPKGGSIENISKLFLFIANYFF